MKKLLCFAVFFISFFLFAQNPQRPDVLESSWRYMVKAETAFEAEQYSEAIRLAVTAQNKRKEESEWAFFMMDHSLKPLEVQRAGENLAEVVDVLQRREDYEAVEIITSVLQKLPPQKLPVTVSQMRKALIDGRVYPEADFMLGKLYMLQGEYAIAANYFTEAWKNADKLNISDQKYDILYQAAALAKVQNDFETFEKTLLLIIAQAGSGVAGIESPFARSVKQSIERGTSLDAFFLMFRHEHFLLISAYNQLASFYYQKNEMEKALSYGALGVLSSFTRAYLAIKERNADYTYTTFSDFQKNVARYTDIVQWSAVTEIWQAFYAFSMILRSNKHTAFSHELIVSLAQNCPEDYWKRIAFKEVFTTVH